MGGRSGQVKLAEVRAVPVLLPGASPYRMAHAEYAGVPTVLVHARTAEGAEGVGQATVTAPAYNPYGETWEGAVGVIRRYLAPAVLGENPLDLERLHGRMDEACPGNPTAKTAIDLALHDLAARALGLPVHRLVGGAVRSQVPLAAPIGYAPRDEMASQAWDAVTAGYRFLKVRVGRDLEEDVGNLRAIRQAVGDGPAIGVDFNQALSLLHRRPDWAVPYIRRLEAFGLESVEQPVAGWDLEGMAAIAAAVDTPLVADESLWTLQDALAIATRRAADVVKIKIVKTGGLWKARKLAAVCEAAGIPVVVGHGVAGSLQNAAELHLAAVLPGLRLPGEMGGFLRLREDVVAAPLPLAGAALPVPDGPGLGVEVRPDRVARLAHPGEGAGGTAGRGGHG